jgi:hypothetical protein
MIIRSWRAIAGSQQVVDQYTAHLERSTFKEMAALEGNLGACLSAKPIAGGRFELLYLSYWKDMEAVKRFATTGVLDDAIVKPSTQKLLESYDPKVEYFEVSGGTGMLPGEINAL